MNVRPYALIENSLLHRIEQQIGAAVSAWRADWGLQDLANNVTCLRAWEIPTRQPDEKWTQGFAHEDQLAWLCWSPDLLKYMQRQIFPTDQRDAIQTAGSSSIAIEGAQAAVKSLAEVVAHSVGMLRSAAISVKDSNPEAQHFQRASGAIVVVVKIGEQSIKCLINHACANLNRTQRNAMILAPLKKVDLVDAFSAASISLKVLAGKVEVDVGNFMTLALGDVIRLPTSVDKPLMVLDSDDRLLFGGHLGTLDKSMAIEVVHYAHYDQ